MSSRESLALVCTRRGTVLLACRAYHPSDGASGNGDIDGSDDIGGGSALKMSRLARTVSSFQLLAASAVGSAPCVIDLAGYTIACVAAEAPSQASRQPIPIAKSAAINASSVAANATAADTESNAMPAYAPGFLVCVAARTPSAFTRDEIALRSAHIRAALLRHGTRHDHNHGHQSHGHSHGQSHDHNHGQTHTDNQSRISHSDGRCGETAAFLFDADARDAADAARGGDAYSIERAKWRGVFISCADMMMIKCAHYILYLCVGV